MKRIVIMGAGTAGTAMANKLVKVLPRDAWQVTVIDRDDVHLYQPGLLFVPFGTYRPEEICRPRTSYLPAEAEWVTDPVDRIAAEDHQVRFVDGRTLHYDLLIIATGTRIAPEETPGLTAEGWRQTAFDFYSLEGATALNHALERFDGGRVVLNVVDMPIKCPVAPLEFLFLADAYFTGRGIRDAVDLVYATPLEGAFTKPRASALLGSMLDARGIRVEPNFAASEVDGASRQLKSYDGRALDYDLLVTVPLHAGSEIIVRSGLGDALGFVPTDKHTLQSKAHPDIFVIGDATDLPSSKAGSVAHFQTEVLLDNVLRHIDGRPLRPGFDGHANCFIETGYDKAILIDFNYETEPLPGRFPLPGIGPFTLLSESYVNHWGKLAFRWMYWNLLLKGEDIPIDANMLYAGKWR